MAVREISDSKKNDLSANKERPLEIGVRKFPPTHIHTLQKRRAHKVEWFSCCALETRLVGWHSHDGSATNFVHWATNASTEGNNTVLCHAPNFNLDE